MRRLAAQLWIVPEARFEIVPEARLEIVPEARQAFDLGHRSNAGVVGRHAELRMKAVQRKKRAGKVNWMSPWSLTAFRINLHSRRLNHNSFLYVERPTIIIRQPLDIGSRLSNVGN